MSVRLLLAVPKQPQETSIPCARAQIVAPMNSRSEPAGEHDRAGEEPLPIKRQPENDLQPGQIKREPHTK